MVICKKNGCDYFATARRYLKIYLIKKKLTLNIDSQFFRLTNRGMNCFCVLFISYLRYNFKKCTN